MISGVVLAGGKSTRLGRNKAIERVGTDVLIQRVIQRLSQLTSEVIVVVASMENAAALNLPPSANVAEDLYLGKGSLGGIFSGISAAKHHHSLLVACDMPFLNQELLKYMIGLRHDYDVVVPLAEGRPETLHAIYSKNCLEPIERRLKADDLKIARFFDEVKVRYIKEEEIAPFDPDHLSFFNINTQEDLDQATALEAKASSR